MFKKHFGLNYLSHAPLSLAFERIIECNIMKDQVFVPPVLDIGCGEGLLATILFDSPIDLGIDPNDRELMRAEKVEAYRMLIKCTGDNIPEPDNSFNTIFSNSVLEHIEELKPVLVEAARLLSDNGYFYATVPSSNFERFSILCTLLEILGLSKASRNFRSFYNLFWSHYHAYSESVWRDLFNECGLTVIESYTYAPRWVCMLNDLLVPTAFLDKITKIIFNRWTIFPSFRKIVAYPIYLFMNPALRRAGRCSNGGLVFIKASKKR